jgi:hypothetical protein
MFRNQTATPTPLHLRPSRHQRQDFGFRSTNDEPPNYRTSEALELSIHMPAIPFGMPGIVRSEGKG